jgi:hypothetical protein
MKRLDCAGFSDFSGIFGDIGSVTPRRDSDRSIGFLLDGQAKVISFHCNLDISR